MPEPERRLDSLFEAAVQLASAAERAAFLDQSCGEDAELRQQVERLLDSDGQVGNFLNQPPPEFYATISAEDDGLNPDAALNAGLSPALTENQAVIIQDAGISVLKTLCGTINVPQVLLRGESTIASEPIVRPRSPEMPNRDPGSRYQLQGEIARGGMGAILIGRDTDLGRDLAIKVLLDQHKDRPEVIQRFIEEAQIGGQLQHPGIAPIYELGQFTDRRPFFSMKLVKGETLSRLLAARAEPAADRGKFLGIFEQVCQTMAYAHSRGVIHRDLKPANIMVGAFGEVQVMDWGLAKVLPAGGIADEKTAHDRQMKPSIVETLRSKAGSDTPGTFASFGSQTQMGSVMGTPAYMPPEQALGDIDHLDERADVFGLGAILCEVLTGKPPYIGSDGTQVFRMASRGNLTDCFARLDDCGADTELIALTKHCLALEPHDRPRDAGVLAGRITGYLESVETKLRETELERAAQTARAESEGRRLEQQQRSTHKLRKMLAGLAVVALIAGLACCAALIANMRANDLAEIATQKGAAAQASAAEAERQRTVAVQAGLATAAALSQVKSQKAVVENSLIKAEKAEKNATTEKIRADREAEVAQQNLYYAQMHLALEAWREPRGLPYMKELLTNWLPRPDSPDRRCWEWFYMNSLPYQNLRTLLESESAGSGRTCTLAWHAASQRLATGTHDGVIRIWDVEREETTRKLIGPGTAGGTWWEARWLAWSPDGGQLAAGFHDGTVHLWDAGSGRELSVIRGSSSAVAAVAYSSDGMRLAVCGREGSIQIWDINSGRLISGVAHPQGVSSGAWSPDEQLFACGHFDGTLTISGTNPGDKITTLHGHASAIHALGWSPKGNQLASTSYDFTARIWDVAAEKMVVGPLRHSHEVTAVSWEPNGNRLATGSIDESVKIWNATSGREEFTL
ncbi:MAG: protein kinase, partial [Planctomycetes bacterium]|nr:protein kinase [Planctomycetota bacterium]